MNPDLSCSCGSHLFAASSIFQTMPDGRTFELCSTMRTPHLYRMRCLDCNASYLMSRQPGKDQGNRLIPCGTPEAKEFVERFTTDGVFSDVDDPEPVKEEK